MTRKRSIKITLGIKSEIPGWTYDIQRFIQFYHSFGLWRTYFSMISKNINENGDLVFAFYFYDKRQSIGIMKYYSPGFTITTTHIAYENKKKS